jgi:hypothetical protein
MQNTIRDNIDIIEVLAAEEHSVGSPTTASIDMSKYSAIHFYISAGTIGSSGTIDAKLQDSDDDSTYADITGKAITQITEAGTAYLYLDNPTSRYLDFVATVGTAASTFSVVALAMKKRIAV